MVTLQLIKEIRSDELYIPGFSTDELDIIVSTSSTIKSAWTVTKNRIPGHVQEQSRAGTSTSKLGYHFVYLGGSGGEKILKLGDRFWGDF